MSTDATNFLESLRSIPSAASLSTSQSSASNSSRPRSRHAPPSNARAWKLLVDPELVKLTSGFATTSRYRVEGTDPDVCDAFYFRFSFHLNLLYI